MKIITLLTTCLLSYSSMYADKEISPEKDQFIQVNHAEVPYLVGFTTDQNAEGFIQYNTYFSPLLAINPNNADMLFSAMNQDLTTVTSPSGTTTAREQEVAISYSTNNGEDWQTDTIPLHRRLGGDLSNGQNVTDLKYSPLGGPEGTIFLTGRFCDLKNDRNRNNYSGIWTNRSTDGGKTWDSKVLVSVQQSDAYTNFTGTAEGTPSLTYDPHQLSNIYIAWDRPTYTPVTDSDQTLTTSGNIFFSRSNDAGAFWSQPVEIYDIAQDIPRGGLCSGVTLTSVVKKDITKALLCSFMRYFTKPSASHLDKTTSTTFTDRVVIRSTDGGKTWSKHAIQVSPFVYAQAHNPTLDTLHTPQFPAQDSSEKAHIAVNRVSGRTYLLWQAGSLSVRDPLTASQHPEILLAASNDAGKEWSPPVTVSRTPKSLLTDNPKAYQAFNGNIIFIGDDLIGIVYNDYRQYDKDSPHASCDTWLAVYKETKHHRDGSTLIGLDFVGEKRLTETSFDANIALNALGNTIGLASHENTLHIAYPCTNAGQDSPDNIQTVYVTPNPDNTYKATVDKNNRVSVRYQSVQVHG